MIRTWAASRAGWIFLCAALALPFLDRLLDLGISDGMPYIFVFAILGLGLNIVTGFTGLLNLGVAAFFAIGVYTYAILSSDIYPFRFGLWAAMAFVPLVGAAAGVLLGTPTLRLRGDYLAIVTLGFGEIIQDILKNLDVITKGTQAINPLPKPPQPYYFLLAFLALAVILLRDLGGSRLGRAFRSIRDDELASGCMGIPPVKTKLLAFASGAALCSLAGGLWACYCGSSNDPTGYDFNLSITVLVLVIVGGMGSVHGVLLGALLVIGLDTILLSGLTQLLARQGLVSTANVYSNPGNYKYMIYGLALILMMRFKPDGILPPRPARGGAQP